MLFTILAWRFPGVLNAPEAMRRLAVRLALLGDDVAPDVAALCSATLCIALYVALLVGALGAVTLLLATPELMIGAVIIAAYAVVFKPRKAVRK